MSLSVPIPEIYHVEVIKRTNREVDASIQEMINILPTDKSIDELTLIIERLSNFKRVLTNYQSDNIRKEHQHNHASNNRVTRNPL